MALDDLAQPQEPLLQFFEYGHLPKDLQEVSRRFQEIAKYMVWNLPPNEERKTALRKLLETKDCAVRTLIFK